MQCSSFWAEADADQPPNAPPVRSDRFGSSKAKPILLSIRPTRAEVSNVSQAAAVEPGDAADYADK